MMLGKIQQTGGGILLFVIVVVVGNQQAEIAMSLPVEQGSSFPNFETYCSKIGGYQRRNGIIERVSVKALELILSLCCAI